MKKIIYTVLCASLMFGISSCQKDNTAGTEAEGGVTISAKVEDVLNVRGTTNEALQNSAQVKIYKPSFGGLVREYTYSTMPEVIYLPAGAGYRVDVIAGELVKSNPTVASFTEKSYKGSASFSITAGVVSNSPIEVNATICNAISNVTFGNSIAESFDKGYKLTIGLDGNNLEYTAANAGADGYFIVPDNVLEPKLEWSFNGSLLKNGEAFTKSGNFTVEAGKKYTMNLIYTEKDGTLSVEILVDKSTTNFNDQIMFEPTSVGISSSKSWEIWATHATVHADVDLTMYDESKVFFQYRKAGTEDEWTRTAAATKVSNDGAFDAVISGLTPETEYEYQLIVTTNSTDQSEEFVPGTKTITTAAAPALPNSSFEEYHTHSDGYDLIYSKGATSWWECGNQSVFGVTVNVTTSSTDIPNPSQIEGSYDPGTNTRSVRMKSAQNGVGSIKVLAAGNLYSGIYGGTEITTMSGKVNFGRPFTGRPTAVRMYVKYNTGKIDMIKNQPSDITLTNETMDKAQIKVALGDWKATTYGGVASSPVLANTAEVSKIINFDTDGAGRKAGDKEKGTIAYGTAIIDGAGGAESVTINGQPASKTYADYNNWNVLTIPIKYFDLKTNPTHIIVSFTASAWGDYMSGSTSSDLYIDAVELIYDSNVIE